MSKNLLQRIYANPRNVWARTLTAVDCAQAGLQAEARRLRESIRYRDDLAPDVHQFIQDWVEKNIAEVVRRPLVAVPSDYNRGLPSALHPPFRSLAADPVFPKPYPSGLALPRIVGNGNDYRFLEEASLQVAPSTALRVEVIAQFEDDESFERFHASLVGQDYDGAIRLHLFGYSPKRAVGEGRVQVEHHWPCMPSEECAEIVLKIAQGADLLLLIDGRVVLEPSLLKRMAAITAVSDSVVHGLVPGDFSETCSPFTSSVSQRHFSRSFPFRDVRGMNLGMAGRLYCRSGGLNPAFSSAYEAGRELAFRLYNMGSYFRPLPTSVVEAANRESAEDRILYSELCPNPWDRKVDGSFFMPKISVYIPAYNSRYIVDAVDSVLDQDIEDAEVCIADDGSTDGLLDRLNHHFGDNPRVRWISGANGGIGFASNRAISMSRGLYVGQLDSDDRLKPGALRKLSTYLDENADVVCCYSSCERVNSIGEYLQDEYSWPSFSREKMLITSITHHFRMFRRQAWERTEKFREDIINAVDYDIFLKLSEVGNFHHIEEKLYERRWHGENTSNVNESFQTTNSHRVQREALKRLNLAQFWDVHVENPEEPRRVTYMRRPGARHVTFWPHYRANPYQRLLYAPHAEDIEIVAGTIDAALREIRKAPDPTQHIFHVHWLNFLFSDQMDETAAQAGADEFLLKLKEFKVLGGQVYWTIHNVLSHEADHRDVEVSLSAQLAELADKLHFHSPHSIPEVAGTFPIPVDKVVIARHGHYIGAYEDIVSREAARAYLGISADDDVILFTGQVRKYKGVDTLVASFREILRDRPTAFLLIAGPARKDPFADMANPLSAFEKSRILFINRFIDDSELQVMFRAADFAVYPYHNILTSGSLLLALSFGVPVVIPESGMVREVLESGRGGIRYDGSREQLLQAMKRLIEAKANGSLSVMAEEARTIAERQSWQPLFPPMPSRTEERPE